MTEFPQKPICQRIKEIRRKLTGQRGKSIFAKQLGLSPSTYDYYEHSRVPPAEILVQMAELADVDLRWLITGEESHAQSSGVTHPAARKAQSLITRNPALADPISAFLDVMEQTANLRMFDPPHGEEQSSADADARARQPAPESQAGNPSLIPILGRSAAGVSHFWADPQEAHEVTSLADRAERYRASAQTDTVTTIAHLPEVDDSGVVELVTLREPLEDDGPVEFLAAAPLKHRYPDAFALRIDGESMSPEIRHGDIVVLSPDCPAEPGRPAVVQLAGAIGVTCKLYRPAEDRIHLVPLNETFPPTTVEPRAVQWALRVVAHIRPSET